MGVAGLRSTDHLTGSESESPVRQVGSSEAQSWKMLLRGPRTSRQQREDGQVEPGSLSQIHICFSLFDSFDWRFRLKIVTQLQAGRATSDAGGCACTVGVSDSEGRRPWAARHWRAQPGARAGRGRLRPRANVLAGAAVRGAGQDGTAGERTGRRGEAAWPRLAACWTSGQLSKGHRPHRATLELFIQDQSVSLRAQAPQIVGISLETAPGAPCLGHACASPPGCRHAARSFLRPGAPSWQRQPGARPPLLPRPARGPGLHHVPRFATADFSISEEGLLPAPPSHPRAPS